LVLSVSASAEFQLKPLIGVAFGGDTTLTFGLPGAGTPSLALGIGAVWVGEVFGVEGEIAPISKYPLESFRRVIDVNVIGVFLGLKHVLPVMLRQNKGSIINTASIAGVIGSPDIAAYTASKHAVIGLTKSAAIECTASAVRVNCVCPGLIDSRMLRAIIEGRDAGKAGVPMEKIVGRIPARRLGEAAEVASIVAFLASDEASYVSGSAYTVDGGRIAG